ncbi:MAG TPA: YIP1 family protein [Terriglobales bacterium]|jgi:hypothetical protein
MAAVPVAPPPPSQTPGLSQGARIVNTFIAPSKTFADLRRSASWWAPFLLIVVFSYLFIFSIDRKIGYDQVTRNEIANSPRADQFDKLPPGQKAQQLKIATAITRGFSYAVPLVILLFYVIVAAILMGVFNMGMNAQIPYKIYLAILVYSGLPGIINAVLGTASMYAGVDPEGFNINNPVATNVAYFMDRSGNKFLYGMASSLDLFIWWGIVLMGIGIATNSKVKRLTAIVVIGALYLLWKLATSALAAR